MMYLPGSYQTGFAPRDFEPRFPELWRGCVGAWASGLGATGGVLRDWSGLQNHVTLTNMALDSAWTVSQGRNALLFDGVNDYGVASRANVPTGPRTISAWFFRSTTTGRRGIFGTRPTGGTNGFFLSTSVTSSGTIAYTHPGITAVVTSAGIWSAGVWNHVAATLSPSLAVLIYLNGRLVHTGSVATQETSNTALWIGTEEGPAPEVFDGMLDDVFLHSRVLNVAELRLLALRRGIAYEPRIPNYAKTQQSNRRRRLLTGMV